MSDKGQSSRFRFPWRRRGSQVEPEPRPAGKTQNPVDRPPFRPAGKAPVKASPSQSPARSESPSPSRTDPPPPSPLLVASQPQAASQVSPQAQSQPTTTQGSSQIPSLSAESPSPAFQPEPKEAISQPPLREPQPNAEIITSETISDAQNSTPKETAIQTHAASRNNTLEETPIQTHAASQNSTPEEIAIQTHAASQNNTPEETAIQIHAASQNNAPEEAVIQTHAASQNNAPKETALQTHAASPEAVVTIASPKKVDHKHLPGSETESKEHKEGEKVVQVLTKEEKANDPGYKEPVAQLHDAETGSGKHAEDLVGVAFQAEQKHKEQETFERKETSATTSSSGKPINTRKDRSTSRLSIQKMVSSTAEQALPHKQIKEDVLKLHKMATDRQMLENTVSVITLTGENRGASMHLSSEPAQEEESIHIHRSYKINPDDSPEATTDGEVSSEGKILEDQMSTEDQQTRAYINSNVQSINNAILFNSSVTEGNPGVHTVFSQYPAESSKSNGKSVPLETHKAQITKTPSEKLTHESTVRRRCLRGLFMEPSDSDPDDPERPRRHGCRYDCRQKEMDSEGIL